MCLVAGGVCAVWEWSGGRSASLWYVLLHAGFAMSVAAPRVAFEAPSCAQCDRNTKRFAFSLRFRNRSVSESFRNRFVCESFRLRIISESFRVVFFSASPSRSCRDWRFDAVAFSACSQLAYLIYLIPAKQSGGGNQGLKTQACTRTKGLLHVVGRKRFTWYLICCVCSRCTVVDWMFLLALSWGGGV